jgi:WXG100 family type VII secretion target
MPSEEEAAGTEFGVNLASLHNAIGTVQGASDTISFSVEQIEVRMQNLSAYWHSPAFTSFEEVHTWFHRASTDLTDLLTELISRMQTAYENYSSAEWTNTKNMTPSGGAS